MRDGAIVVTGLAMIFIYWRSCGLMLLGAEGYLLSLFIL
jgi:hypothetical protein